VLSRDDRSAKFTMFSRTSADSQHDTGGAAQPARRVAQRPASAPSAPALPSIAAPPHTEAPHAKRPHPQRGRRCVAPNNVPLSTAPALPHKFHSYSSLIKNSRLSSERTDTVCRKCNFHDVKYLLSGCSLRG